jgi:ligand-binding sensor domain-containing protein/two-component sensor histidine kinase
MWLRRLLSFLFLLNLVLSSFGQQHPFIQFTTRDGLAQSQVRCVEQDANGFIWFGTVGGASRFDGIDFNNYAIREGLPDPQIEDIVAMDDGTVWLATGGGLAKFSGNSMVQIPLPESSTDQRINLLTADGSGGLLIATHRDGVYRMTSGDFKRLSGFNLSPDIAIRAIIPLAENTFLFGTQRGLYRLSNNSVARIPVGDKSTKSISAMQLAQDGSIWVSTYGNGIYRIKPNGEFENYDEIDGLLQNNIRHIEIDSQGRIWAASKFGLNLIEDGEVRAFTIYRGMPNDNIWCTFEDDEGSIWLGTDGAGVLKYSGDRFVTYTTVDGLCSDLVMSIVADERADIWLGTYGNGVCRMDGMAMINTLDGLSNNTIWSGLHVGDGLFYFGTSDGITAIRHGLVQPFDGKGILDRTRVFSMVPHPSGDIWCGTRNGAAIIRSSGDVEDIDVPVKSVRSIVHRSDGYTFLCSANGIVKKKENQLELITNDIGLSDNNVFCAVLDSKDRLWAGTANGLNCVTDTGITSILLGPDYGSNYINLLNLNSGGKLAIGTNNGLYIAEPDLLIAGGRPVHFTEADGLRSGEFNLNATYTDTLGRSWYGTTGGLLLHDPSRRSPNEDAHIPRIHITGIRSFLKETDWSGSASGTEWSTGLPSGLEIAPRKNYLTFDYVGINHTEPEKVEYRYRLSGHDDDWLPATKARFASYSSLNHGNYTFEVIARVPGSEWSAPASFSFTVLRPFWLTWWFILLCASVLALATYGVVRWRSAQRRSAERTKQLVLRSRMLQLEQQALNANMNRHFVFNALNSIQFYINKQERQTANKYLTSFAKLIRKNLDNSQTDTTTLAEELERLELYLELEHMRFADKFDYEITIDNGLDLIGVAIPAMMLQPYVENSIWHGILPSERHGKVRIMVSAAGPERVSVRITDNGIGFEESLSRKQQGDHISKGIEITKGRADVHRRLNISDINISGPSQILDGTDHVAGTEVTIELPVTTVPRSEE